IDDYANILGQIHSIPELVNAPMGGPTICCSWDLYTLLTNGYLGAFRAFLKYLTIQHYPQNNCFAQPPAFDIGYFTNHANVVGLSTYNLQGVRYAQQEGLNVSMSEFNSVACGGYPGVSNTFAALLWTIDYALQLASLGYTSAYIHTREPGVTYNLFDPPAANLDQNMPGWTTGAPYHSLLFVTDALHSEGKGMAVVDLQAPSPENAANSVAAYAIYPTGDSSSGIARMPPTRFVIINYAANGPLNFQFNQNNTGVTPAIGGLMSIGKVNVKQLTADALPTNANITWAGQVVDGGGNLQGTPTNITVTGCGSSKGCTIEVPGPGAVVVYLDGPDSSIAGAPNTTGDPNASQTSTEEVSSLMAANEPDNIAHPPSDVSELESMKLLAQEVRNLRILDIVDELQGELEVPDTPRIGGGYADIYHGKWTSPQGDTIEVAIKVFKKPIQRYRSSDDSALASRVEKVSSFTQLIMIVV
ncbi:hypothetical protein FS837_001498, partial [Tulasnella sp. UAMH 9824]